MRALIADDDRISREIVARMLAGWKFDVETACDGALAWDALSATTRPTIAILDWMMPELDGTEVCRRLRTSAVSSQVYVLLLTGRQERADLVAGLDAGADDYLTKPFDPEELRARVQVGVRVLTLQQTLADQVTELQDALSRVKQLQGLLPICSYCKRIRNDENYWEQLESYLAIHSEAQFSHGICPTCFAAVQVELDAVGTRR